MAQKRKYHFIWRMELEARMAGWYQCLVCLRIITEETRCWCSREDRQTKLTLLIVTQYDVDSLPDEIRTLVYPNGVPEELRPYLRGPWNSAPSQSPSGAATSEAQQNGEQTNSTSHVGDRATPGSSRGISPTETVSSDSVNDSDSDNSSSPEVLFDSLQNSSRNLVILPESPDKLSSTVPPELLHRKHPQDLLETSPPLLQSEPSILEEVEHLHCESGDTLLHATTEDTSIEAGAIPEVPTTPPCTSHEVPDTQMKSFSGTSGDPGRSMISLNALVTALPRITRQTIKKAASSQKSGDLLRKNATPPPSTKKVSDEPPVRRSSFQPPPSTTEALDFQGTRKEPLRHTCIFCEKSFARSYALEEHLRLHIKETPFVCSHCGKQFSLRASWNGHVKQSCPNILTPKKPHPCPTCKKPFSTKFNLARHLKNHTSNREILRCSLCPATFMSHSGLYFHLRVKHDQKEEHECDQCGKIYAHLHHLRRHLFRHRKLKDYCCVFCGKGFLTNEELFQHLRIHTREVPYPCPKCDESFRTQCFLHFHLEVAHSVRTGKVVVHSCVFCAKQFLTKDYLDSHLGRHIREKWFSCKTCRTEFVSLGSLTRHNKKFHK